MNKKRNGKRFFDCHVERERILMSWRAVYGKKVQQGCERARKKCDCSG